MATKTVSKNIVSLVEAVNAIFAGLIEEFSAQASNGKIKVDDIKQAIEDSKFQSALTVLIQEKMPKATRSREKKLKDPEAPKRPKSSYLFFCDDKRSEIKKANPELKATEISTKLGEMWQALTDKKKAKYVAKAETAKGEYKEAMTHYERPSDEDLAKLDVNQRRRGSKGEGKTKKKKDPNAPKRPMTAFLYFSQEKRAEVKEANPEMKGTEFSVELGRMWKEDYADEGSRKKWVNAAAKDKARYDEEMKEYTPPAKDAEESDKAAPKKKRGRPKKSDSKEAPKVAKGAKGAKGKTSSKPSDDEDSDDEEEPGSPKSASNVSKVAKGKTSSKPSDDEDSDDEDEPKPVTKSKSKEPVAKPTNGKRKAKIEMSMGTAKIVATPTKGKAKVSQVEKPSDEEMF